MIRLTLLLYHTPVVFAPGVASSYRLRDVWTAATIFFPISWWSFWMFSRTCVEEMAFQRETII